MNNEHSKQNNGGEGEGKGKGKRKINNVDEIFSSATKATIEKIKRKHRAKKALCTILDNTSPGYEWLLPGWVAEERHMGSGRIYKYYYDPEGNLYYSKGEVLAALENAGLIVLDVE